MAKTWAEIRNQVRTLLLKDVLTEGQTAIDYRWTDEEMLIAVDYALTQFAQHTAVATATGFSPATGTVYPLPDDIYDGDGTEQTLFVYVTTPSQTKYFDPVRYTPTLSRMSSEGYYIHPDKTLQINAPSTEAESTLSVQYFAYWPTPVLDTDVIGVPRWAIMPLVYMTAAQLLSGDGLRSALIRQWGAKPDTGNPEDNPIKKHQKWFLDMAALELRNHAIQDRINAFRALRDEIDNG